MFPTVYLFKQVDTKTVAAKLRRRVCVSWGCKRRAEKTKKRCSTCRSRLYRLRNPMRYAFYQVKESARKRNIGFELTFPQFEMFCKSTGYVDGKGQKPDSLTIDRIRTNEPYSWHNIRIMSHADNSSHIHEDTY